MVRAKSTLCKTLKMFATMSPIEVQATSPDLICQIEVATTIKFASIPFLRGGSLLRSAVSRARDLFNPGPANFLICLENCSEFVENSRGSIRARTVASLYPCEGGPTGWFASICRLTKS